MSLARYGIMCFVSTRSGIHYGRDRCPAKARRIMNRESFSRPGVVSNVPLGVHSLYRPPIRSMRHLPSRHASHKPPPSRARARCADSNRSLRPSFRPLSQKATASATAASVVDGALPRAQRPRREPNAVTRTPLGDPAWYTGAASPDGVCPCVTRQLYRLGKRSQVLISPHFARLLYYRSMPRRFFPTHRLV
jgi:hypothetical protein